MVKAIESKEEFDQKLKDAGDHLVVVDFHAVWCGPCKMIAPKIKDMEKEFPDVIFVKVDVDEVAEVAEEQKISAMPTFKFIKKGAVVGEVVGASEAKIREEILKQK